MSEAEAQLRLEASVSGLADRVPLVSARSVISKGQRNFLIGLLVVIFVGLVFDVRLTATLIIAVSTLGYLVAVVYRTYLFTRSSKTDALEVVTDEEARGSPTAKLPFYTIMIPAYRESSVIVKLIQNVAKMEYPLDRLEVLILVEEDDEETLGAMRQRHRSGAVQVGPDPGRRASHQAQSLELRVDTRPG